MPGPIALIGSCNRLKKRKPPAMDGFPYCWSGLLQVLVDELGHLEHGNLRFATEHFLE